MRRALYGVIEAFFRVLFTYDCLGEEKLPESGPAVVAANHPSYLDPVLLSLQVRRPIRFMAWDALFKVPLLGAFIRAFGAFPVDIRKGKGREAYERARALVEQGEMVGIFPEGRRSETGWMEPVLREGAARLAWETGAPLYPATIAAAHRAWPHFRLLPQPARIRVRYHDPIDPAPWRDQPEDVALPALLGELRRRVERSLMPGVKADLRMNLLYRRPSPWLRAHEYLPPLMLALLAFWKTRSLADVLPAYAYVGYLLVDHYLLPQGRLVKWLRNSSPVLFLLAWGPQALALAGWPAPWAAGALTAVTLGALFPYLYERGYTALTFIKGLVAAFLLGTVALRYFPTPAGLHVVVGLYAAAFAWERRTVFWRWSVPILLAYAGYLGLELGRARNVVPAAVAALLGWGLARLFPHREGGPRAETAAPPHDGLGLLR